MNANWKSDLEGWLSPFPNALRHKVRARMCPVYVAGLIGAGDRKSIQPIAARDGAATPTSFIASSPTVLGTPCRSRRPCSLRPTGWSAVPGPG